MSRALKSTALLVALSLVACTAAPRAPKAPPAELVLRGGSIFSALAGAPLAQALAIRGGRIAFVGSDLGAQQLVGKQTRVVDLAGRFVMPGLVDGHVHPLGGGQLLSSCSLGYEALTRTQLRRRVAACLAADPSDDPDDWLEIVAWQAQAILPAGTRITKKTLDRIETPRPILVRGADGHTALASSRALALAGISAGTPDPPDGKLLRDASGAPNGYLLDGAIALVADTAPPPTEAEKQAYLEAALRHMASIGVTSFLAAAVTPDQLGAFGSAPQGSAPRPRAHLALAVDPTTERDPARVVARLRSVRETLDRDDLRVRTAKIFLDGVMEYPAQTAALLAPYRDGGRGELYVDPAALSALVSALDAEGWQLHFHAIGDRAVRSALDAIEAARAKNGPRDARHTLTHLELVDPADVPRFAALGAVANFSPQWALRDAFTLEALEPFIGPERHARLYPIRSLADAGAALSFGSDWPVDPTDRLDAIETAVTRERATGAGQPGVLGKDQALSLEAALRAYTAGAAYQIHRERELGSLAPGLLADFIVLSESPLAVEPAEISELSVLETWIGGQRVYAAPPAPTAGAPSR